jgi:chemotaxis protein MotB
LSEHKPNKDHYKPLISLDGSHSKHPEEGGEGNWLVSYADMMTLLVGFFVILLSFSSIDSEKLENVRKEITVQFGGTYQVPYGEMKDRIRNEIAKLGLGDQFIIKDINSGLEISFLGTLFFETGSVNLRPEATDLLKKLIPVVKAETKNQFDIVVEGHTDDVAVGSNLQFKNNWELSSIRACRVLEAFANEGFQKLSLTAVGFGETRPIVANRDASGNAIATNQAQNRRVVIKILKRVEAVMGPTKESPAVE